MLNNHSMGQSAPHPCFRRAQDQDFGGPTDVRRASLPRLIQPKAAGLDFLLFPQIELVTEQVQDFSF